MGIEDCERVLSAAIPLRPPTWHDGSEEEHPRTPAPQKVSDIEDWLMTTAYAQAELEEALHWVDSHIARLKRAVDTMTGWEVALPRKAQDRITREDVASAKRTVSPTTFELGTRVRSLRESIVRQIERFRGEAIVASRVYSVISGA